MEPLHTIPNMNVKRYSGENTSREIYWENITMPKFFHFFDNANLSIYHRFLGF